MPLGCKGYLQLMDSLGNSLGNQLEIGTINAAEVNSNQEVIAVTKTNSAVDFDKTTIEHVINARKAAIKLVFDTPNSPGKVKIYASDVIDISLNLMVDYLINGEEE